MPSAVVLRRSARASLDMPGLELRVPLRSTPRRLRPRTAMCTQQVWDLEGLEQRVPKHAEFWFRYHADFLGIDEIYLYDWMDPTRISGSCRSCGAGENFSTRIRLLRSPHFERSDCRGMQCACIIQIYRLVSCHDQCTHSQKQFISMGYAAEFFTGETGPLTV